MILVPRVAAGANAYLPIAGSGIGECTPDVMNIIGLDKHVGAIAGVTGTEAGSKDRLIKPGIPSSPDPASALWSFHDSAPSLCGPKAA